MLESLGYVEPVPYRNESISIGRKRKAGLIWAFLLYGGIFLGLAVYMFSSVKHIRVDVAGEQVSFYTFATKISDVLEEAGFKGELGPIYTQNDVVEGETKHYWTLSETLDQPVRDGMTLKINRNSISKRPEERKVNPPTRRVWNIFMEPGEERIMNQGEQGIIKDIWIFQYKNDRLVHKYLQDSKLVKGPKPIVVASGSYDSVSREGTGQGHPIKFVATAYTHTGYRTAVGAKTRKGIVAVDPKVIPLGTRLYVKGYGYGVAADTGGLIKGKKIDLFFDTHEEAVKWGKRKIDLYILDKN